MEVTGQLHAFEVRSSSFHKMYPLDRIMNFLFRSNPGQKIPRKK